MKGFHIGIISMVAFVATIFVATSCNGGASIGSPAPDFSYPDLDGNTMHLSDFRGRPVLVVVWDQGCQNCPILLDSLQTLCGDKNNSDLVVLSVNIDNDKPGNIKKYAMCKNHSFTVLTDPGGTIRERYGIRQANPILICIDKSGILREVLFGSQSVDQVAKSIGNL